MVSLIKALINISGCKNNNLFQHYKSKIRANQMGEGLEYFIEDSFCAIPGTLTDKERASKHSEIFSYLGNQNNPPDAIIKGSDAIEIKKLEGLTASHIALNSSYPKAKLYSDSPMITKACQDCEKDWKEKDIIYAVGNVVGVELKLLVFLYGDCYAASKEVYEKVANAIKSGIITTNLEFDKKTKELGRVNKVDPLGITYLRIRGMWGIKAPAKLFEKEIGNLSNDFTVAVIMRETKYNSFSEKERDEIEKSKFEIENTKIKDPDNPAKLLDAKVLVYRR